MGKTTKRLEQEKKEALFRDDWEEIKRLAKNKKNESSETPSSTSSE